MFAHSFSEIVDAVKAFRKKPKPRPDELFTGAPRPSTVLVELICADWIKNGVQMQRKVDEPMKSTMDIFRETSTVQTEWYWVEFTRTTYRGWNEEVRLRMVEPSINLTDHEVALLVAAKKKAEQLAAERLVAEREAKGQEDALKAIEKYLGIDNKPTGEAVS